MSSDAFDLDRIGGRRALRDLVDEVLAAGEDALRLYEDGRARVERKPDRSPVTEADHAVEARLRALIEKRWPTAGFLGEESGHAPSNGDLRFVVDPIDGTRAFIRGIPTWSVLVGIEAGGEPVVGIAFMPATGDLFVGVRGDGAEGNGRPLRVSAVDDLSAAVVCHGSIDQFHGANALPLLERLALHTYTQRGFSDFEGYRNVLLGRADAMIDPGIKPWDVCPAAVLVREAGGRFTSMDGEETIHGNGGLASNGAIHDALVALVRGA